MMEEQSDPQMDFTEKYSFFALGISAQWHNTPKSFWFVTGRVCNARGYMQEEEF